jgi:hypothetical protein
MKTEDIVGLALSALTFGGFGTIFIIVLIKALKPKIGKKEKLQPDH